MTTVQYGQLDHSRTSWIYRSRSPFESIESQENNFHESEDTSSLDNPTIFKYQDEFLNNNREKLRSYNEKISMANVIPWLMSVSLIGAQNLGTLSRPEVVSTALLPLLDSSGYYETSIGNFQNPTSAQVGPSIRPCETPTSELNYNYNRPVDPFNNRFGGLEAKESPQNFVRETKFYINDNNFAIFQNKINPPPNDVRLAPDVGLRNIKIENEEYKTTHKFTPQNNNGFTDEYAGPAMEQIYSWKTVDFEFDNEIAKQRAIDAGHYELENALPLGIEIWGDKIFLTLPRWKQGIPATLATVPRYPREQSPKLRPYPSWGWHDPGNCEGLISVFRVQVDECDRLWVLDSGQTHITSDPKQTCPPKVLIFDLKTDKLLKSYIMPKEYIKQDSLYSNIAVDVRDGECKHAFAYLADVWRFGIVVYDLFEDKSFRTQHHFFFPDPLSSRYELHGMNFQWTDGIFGLSLSPIDINNDRTLFFHPMSSFREFAVATSVLKDENAAEENPEMFIPVGKPRAKNSGHSSGSAMDRNGVMFFNMVTRDSIWCWDSRKEYIPQNLGVIGQSNVSLIFPNDIKIDHEPDQSMWALSNKLPMYLYDRMDSQEVNYRLFRANVKEAIKNTVCDPNYIVPPSEQNYDETC